MPKRKLQQRGGDLASKRTPAGTSQNPHFEEGKRVGSRVKRVGGGKTAQGNKRKGAKGKAAPAKWEWDDSESDTEPLEALPRLSALDDDAAVDADVSSAFETCAVEDASDEGGAAKDEFAVGSESGSAASDQGGGSGAERDADGAETNGSGDEEGIEDQEGSASKGGGMGDVMAKILSQRIDGKAPVLAKRKTPAMRAAEEAAASRAAAKVKHRERTAKLEQQLVMPTVLTADYERSLRKIATRGVVALFNAISKEQHPAGDEVEATGKLGKGGKASKSGRALREASRAKFLDLLNGDAEKAGQSYQAAAAEGAKQASSWSVLRDDLGTASTSLKDWDKSESSEGEGDGLGPGDLPDFGSGNESSGEDSEG